jgi:superfamily II DNA or RNA helicase
MSIRLDIYAARTFFEGHKHELRQMFHALRVEDKGAAWKAHRILRQMGYFAGYKDKKERIEKVKLQTKYIRFYNRRSDSFPSGLVPRVLAYLDKKGIQCFSRDHRRPIPKFKPITKFHFKDKVESREEQIVAANVALKKGRGILHMATNAGKTEIACAIISELYGQQGNLHWVLFFVHRTGLVRQTVERFRLHLGHKIPVAYIGGGHRSIPSSGVLVATTQTASKMVSNKNHRFLEFLESCDIVFIDEFHVNRAWAATKILDNCVAPMRLGLSGTIDKNSKVKYLHYMGLTGPIIAEVRNKELVGLGRSAKPHIRMVEVSSERIEKEDGFAGAYREGIVHNRVRNRLVVKEAVRYVNKDYPTLVTVARVSHGYDLLERLEKAMDVPCAFIHGGTSMELRKKTIKKFEHGDISVLIASPIFDTGMDVPAIKAWVNAASGKGWELVLQRLGRVLRRKEGSNRVYITDFIDLFNEYLMHHSLKRLKYYRKEEIANIEVIDA